MDLENIIVSKIVQSEKTNIRFHLKVYSNEQYKITNKIETDSQLSEGWHLGGWVKMVKELSKIKFHRQKTIQSFPEGMWLGEPGDHKWGDK